MTDEVIYQHSFLNLPPIPCLPKTKDSQGQQAVKSGKAAEATIYCILKERGYQVAKQYRFTSPQGNVVILDFYVTNIPRFSKGLAIESRWQETSGSVDEKLPHLAWKIKHDYPCPAIVVYGGGGAKPQLVELLKQQADGNKLLAVFSFEEFLTWTIRNL